MSAPIGNDFAVGNNGGRPPIYDESNIDDVNKLANLCESYFEYIKGESKENKIEIEPNVFETKTTWARQPEPPTVTGLTLYVGFSSKSTLYDYAEKQEFSDSIKRALTKIEQYHEIATSYGEKCTGNIFVLKNFGWKDNQGIDHTTNGKDLNNTATQIVFLDADDAD